MNHLAPLEIQALSKIMDELDYYQILHLHREASAAELKRAYFQTSRTFHPDANRHLDPDLLDECQRIAKRVTEAYCVLRDPRKRKIYDAMLSGNEGARLQLADAKAAQAKQESEGRGGKTPQGRQFFKRAMEGMSSGNMSVAIQNLQMALTFEPSNELFKERLEEARARQA